jgi:hypothetical protein
MTVWTNWIMKTENSWDFSRKVTSRVTLLYSGKMNNSKIVSFFFKMN